MQRRTAKPVVLIIHPAWPRCGSDVVFARQAAGWRALGFRVVDLAFAAEWGSTGASDAFWRDYHEATSTNEADRRFFAAAPGGFPMKMRMVTAWAMGRARTHVSQRAEIARMVPLPGDLVAELASADLRLIHANHYFSMAIAERIRSRLGRRISIVLDTHDIQSRQYHTSGFVNLVTRRPDPLERMLADEEALMAPADLIVHLNHEEVAFWRDRMPVHEHRLVYPSVVAHEAHHAEPSDILAVFSGNKPNQNACRWFLDEVMTQPELAGRTLAIVGAIDGFLESFGDGELVRRWRDQFKGQVADLAPWYAGARVVALPMTMGEGISIKTVEAWAYARNFVGTSKAYRGIDPALLAQHGVEPVNDAAGFARRLAACLDGKEDASDAGAAIYEELFTERAYRDRLRDVMTTVGADR